MSETCWRLRAIALPLLFREVSNWKIGSYTGGAWPSTVWPYIRVVSVYDQPGIISRKLFNNADLFSTLPSLDNVTHIRLDLFSDAPDLLGVFTLPLLLAITALPHLKTLNLRQSRFDGPSLMHAIAQMHQLTTLTLAVSPNPTRRFKLKRYDRFGELINVAEVLQVLAPVLVKLEISGDLIDLQIF
ncbi:hypothetical protein C0995_000945, partial [Termitomyces sp. Mi166